MKRVSDFNKIFWNMIGGTCNACSSMILLIIVNRFLNAEYGGMFSLAFAIGQMLITVATLEVRNYQSTDLKEKFSFADYFSLRIITCIVMMGISLLYVKFNGYEGEKGIVVILLCCYKMIEGFSDVFEGLFQQHDRIDLSGKSMAYRVVISTIIFTVIIQVTRNLIESCIALVVSSFLICILYNTRKCREFKKIRFHIDVYTCIEIIKNCIPIALGAFMIMYIANAPKYAIDKYLDLQMQNTFSILFMPAFAINLFSLFVFRPMLTSVTMSWLDKDIKRFLNIMKKAGGWLALVTSVFVLGAYFLGIPILSWIYNVDLSAYRNVLILIMIGGSLNALMTIFRFSLTAIREQNISMIAFIFSFVFSIICVPVIVRQYGLIGAALAYIISMLLMNIVFLMIMINKVKGKFL